MTWIDVIYDNSISQSALSALWDAVHGVMMFELVQKF